MPGPSRWRAGALQHAVIANKVSEDVLDDRVRNVLKTIKRAAKSGVKEGQEEQPRDLKETSALLRKAAADSIVLMKNDTNILPLDRNKTVAVIGPNAKISAFCGGGSAALTPYYSVTPFDGVHNYCSDVKFSQGCYGHKDLPLLDGRVKTSDGQPGLIFRVYNEPPGVENRECVDEIHITSSNIHLTDYYQSKIKDALFYAEIETYLTPEVDETWDFGLTVQGTARLFIDGVELIDNATTQVLGHSFFGAGTIEEQKSMALDSGRSYKLLIEFASAVTSKLKKKSVVAQKKGGVRLGGAPRLNPEEAIEQAVALARETDQVVVFAGLNVSFQVVSFN
jgi:beta-glucosidase